MKHKLLMVAVAMSVLSTAAVAAGMGAGAGGMGAGAGGMGTGASSMNTGAMRGSMGAGNIGGTGMGHSGASKAAMGGQTMKDADHTQGTPNHTSNHDATKHDTMKNEQATHSPEQAMQH